MNLGGYLKLICSNTYIIPKDMTFVTPSTFPGVGPGDCLFMEAGVKTRITFKGLKGEPGNPILITNQGGLVDINTAYTAGWAVYFRDCQHIKFSGKGDGGYKYGIKISEAKTGALNGYSKTQYLEIENIEITNINGIGISSQTNYDESGNPVTRGEWTQHDTIIHDCYIHDVGGEGMYLGGSGWHKGICPELDGVYVYDNILENIGFDGIQISSAPDNVEVHHNYLNGTGQSMEGRPPTGANNVAGVLIGAGTTGKWYNNKIINSGGRAIWVSTGPGSFDIYNNLILNTGVMGWDGISNGMSIHNNGVCRHNTIINVKDKGIQVNTGVVTIRDNIIAGYGDLATYGGNVYNNIESKSLDTIGFVNPGANDFHLLSSSSAVGSGSDPGYPAFDLDDVTRPQGITPDIGAYEYIKYIDPCEGVVCENICVGDDLWSQKCVDGGCVSDQLIESNSVTCGYDPCEGVVCDNICIGKDLWSQNCEGGYCVPDQLLESNSASCGYDPCEGVVCDNICIGLDLWSQNCEGGSCIPDQLIESNSVTCELCEGVVCGNTCVGDDLWSQRCDPDTGNCVPNQLLQLDSINCKIPDQVPSDESTIKTYIILGGFGLMGLAMLILRKK